MFDIVVMYTLVNVIYSRSGPSMYVYHVEWYDASFHLQEVTLVTHLNTQNNSRLIAGQLPDVVPFQGLNAVCS